MMNNYKKDKKHLWMYHPNVNVRLLRVKPPNKGIDYLTNLTPIYNSDINIGILISSYGEVNDIKERILSLNDYKILIYDDCSPNINEIKKLKSSNVDVYSPEKSIWHSDDEFFFDQSSFKYGLDWAKSNKIDILIKINSTSILFKNDIENLLKLIKNSNGITFSRSSKECLFMTDVFAVNVNSWTCDYVDNLMKWYNENEIPIISEYWYYELAKELDCQVFSSKYEKYKKSNFKGYLKSGYVEWKLLND